MLLGFLRMTCLKASTALAGAPPRASFTPCWYAGSGVFGGGRVIPPMLLVRPVRTCSGLNVPAGQPSPVNLGHASTAEYQRAEFIHQPIVLGRIVLGKILLHSLQEFPLAMLLAFQAKADECGDGLAHAC